MKKYTLQCRIGCYRWQSIATYTQKKEAKEKARAKEKEFKFIEVSTKDGWQNIYTRLVDNKGVIIVF